MSNLFSKGVVPNYNPNNCQRDLMVHIPFCLRIVKLGSFCQPNGCKMVFLMVLLCISLNANGVGYAFISLLAIYIFPSIKCLFIISSVHFSLEIMT